MTTNTDVVATLLRSARPKQSGISDVGSAVSHEPSCRPVFPTVAVPGLFAPGLPSRHAEFRRPMDLGGHSDPGSGDSGRRRSVEFMRRSAIDPPTAPLARRDLLAPLRRRESVVAQGRSPIRRTITVGELVYKDADVALDALRVSFPAVDGAILARVFGLLNANNVSYPKADALVTEVSEALVWLRHHDPKTANKDSWVILHRFKAGSFRDYLRARHGSADLEGSKQADYDSTSARYDPTKFGNKKEHSWAGNAEWLDEIIDNKKVAKVLLTAIPLGDDNIFRFERLGKKFSAYAREIARLLLAGYIPLWRGSLDEQQAVTPLDTVVMVRSDTLPPGQVTDLVRANSRVDREIAKSILLSTTGEKADHNGDQVSTGRTEVGISEAKKFFLNAGLPVVGIEESPRPVVNPRGGEDAQKIAYLAGFVANMTGPQKVDFYAGKKEVFQRIADKKPKYVGVFGETGWTALKKFMNVNTKAIQQESSHIDQRQRAPQQMEMASAAAAAPLNVAIDQDFAD